jgi:hypothetical protein
MNEWRVCEHLTNEWRVRAHLTCCDMRYAHWLISFASSNSFALVHGAKKHVHFPDTQTDRSAPTRQQKYGAEITAEGISVICDGVAGEVHRPLSVAKNL